MVIQRLSVHEIEEVEVKEVKSQKLKLEVVLQEKVYQWYVSGHVYWGHGQNQDYLDGVYHAPDSAQGKRAATNDKRNE